MCLQKNVTMKKNQIARTPLSRISRIGITAGAVFLTAAITATSYACDSCNFAFKDEVLNQRADTLAGRDIIAAIENQKDLPLEGYTSLSSRSASAPAPEPTLLAQASQESSPSEPPSNPPAEQIASEAKPELPPMLAGGNFSDIVQRDEGLATRSTSWVSQDATPDKTFTIELGEGLAYLGNGVMYNGFLIGGKIPGPTFTMDEGDVIELKVKNNGVVPHGSSIHAAYTQTSKYLGAIPPGEERSFKFRATHPGVFMYHCAPGGHAIPMHVLFGQYGMMVVRPTETKYKLEEELGRKPDVEISLIQHEWYANGKDAIEGNPMYVTFNGKLFRYIEEPIPARPGDYVRVNFLNIGPNLLSTFHIVGILWDYAYWQGHPEAVVPGGQSVTTGPADSWVLEFRIPPEEGAYTMLSHAVGSTSRGAIGLIVADENAETPVHIAAEGLDHTQEELAEMAEDAVRTISPFEIGSEDVDGAEVYGSHVDDVTVTIIGNSFYPKVIDIKPGTTVTWINEDAFAYLDGEFAGIHNAVSTSGPERFVSPLLAHAETYSFTFEEEGEYDYICTPHPYMKGKVIVSAEPEEEATPEVASTQRVPMWLATLMALGLIATSVGLIRKKS